MSILIAGDVMLDHYVYGDVTRISAEAPVPIVKMDRQIDSLGGAGNVAAQLATLGEDVTLLGVIGDDVDGHQITYLCANRQISSWITVDVNRPTTVKRRIIGRSNGRHQGQMLRVDSESTEPYEFQSNEFTLDNLSGFDAVILSDYGKGVCTDRLCRDTIASCNYRDIPVIVDPHKVDAKYARATIVKPNRYEAWRDPGDDIEAAKQTARGEKSFYDCLCVIMTLDKDGMVIAGRDDSRIWHQPSEAIEVTDISGAGDTVAAMLTLAIARGLSIKQAVEMASRAAAEQVSRHGTAILSWKDIYPGANTVLANGCFDALHSGHIACLREAKEQGEWLQVLVNSDESIRHLKGEGRPLVDELTRIRDLYDLGFVDEVILNEEYTPNEHIERTKPNVLVKGGDTDEVVGREIVEAYGGRVHITKRIPNVSTTILAEAQS